MGSPSSNIAAMMLGPDMIRQRQQLKQGQQNIDIQAQEARRHAEANDEQIQQLASQGMVKYVNGGAVLDAMSKPDAGSDDDATDAGMQPAAGGPYYRKADPSRTTTHTTADGHKIQLEWPTYEEQNQLRASRTAQDIMAQMTGESQPGVLDAQQRIAQSQATGKAATDQDIRAKFGVRAGDAFSKEQLGLWGVNPDYHMLPPEVSQFAGRVVPAEVRGNASENIADGRNQAAFDRVKYKADLDAQAKQENLDQNDAHFQKSEEDKGTWNAARDSTKRWLSNQTTGRQKVTQDAINARSFLNNFERSSAQHAALSRSALQEEQKQNAATVLLGSDPTGQPNTKDGEPYTDPFDGKTTPMNSFKRAILAGRLKTSQASSADMRSKISDLENLRDNLMGRIGGGDATSATPGASATTPTNPPAGALRKPAAAGQSDMARIQTGDGRVGRIPRANLDAAKKKDPKLTLLPDAGSATGR